MEDRDLGRKIRIGRLMDFYGPLITERRSQIVRMYCEEDMSLQEIASFMTENGNPVTWQGVYDAVTKSEKQLSEYEEKLGLIDRYDKMAEEARRCLEALEAGKIDEVRKSLSKMTEL